MHKRFLISSGWVLVPIFFVIIHLFGASVAHGIDSIPVGSQNLKSIDVILLIDNSASMDDVNDPLQRRVDAARLFVDFLRTTLVTGSAHRAGVINFGGELGITIPLRYLADDTVSQGIQAERILYTDFERALAAAYAEFQAAGSFDSAHQPMVVLLTDGHPCTPELEREEKTKCEDLSDKALQRYFADHIAPQIQKLRDGGATLYVLALGDVARTPDFRSWNQLAAETGGLARSIASDTDLLTEYRNILGEVLNTHVVGPVSVEPGTRTFTLRNPYLASVTFSFLQQDPTAPIPVGRTLTLSGPRGLVETLPGQVEHAGDLGSGLYEIYTLLEPPAGVYTVTLTSDAPLSFWQDEIWPIIQVAPISSPRDMDDPPTIQARLMRNGHAIVAPLDFQAVLTAANRAIVPLVLHDLDADGLYTATVTTLPEEGEYDLGLVVRADDLVVAQRQIQSAFSTLHYPEIAAIDVAPLRPMEGDDLHIRVQVEAAYNLRRQAVRLAVVDERGRIVTDQTLSGADGVFGTTLTGTLPAGWYDLVVTIPDSAMPEGAAPVQSRRQMEIVSPLPSPTPTPAPTPAPQNPVILELGHIRFSPAPPRHGQSLEMTVPVMTSAMTITGITVVLRDASGSLISSTLTPHRNAFSGMLPELNCQWRWTNLNLYPCARYEMTLTAHGIQAGRGKITVSSTVPLHVRWPAAVEWAFAFLGFGLVLMIVISVEHGIQRIRLWKTRRILKKIDRKVKKWKRVIDDPGSNPEDIFQEIQDTMDLADKAIKSVSHRQLERVIKEGKDQESLLLIPALYKSRDLRPGEAIQRITEVARRGWVERTRAGVALAWLLKQRDVDKESVLAWVLKDVPDPSSLLEVASQAWREK